MQNFCTKDNRQQVYFLDKKTGSSGKTNIVNVAQEKDFYVDVSQQDKDYFEKYYSQKVEPVLGMLLNHIISASILGSENTPLLSGQERKTFSNMLVHQMLRTRNARNLMREKADTTSATLVTQLLQIPELKKRKDLIAVARKHYKLSENIFKEISLPLAIDENRLTKYISLIDSMLCTFYYNKTDVDFITSDCPICIKQMSTDALGLGVAGIGNIDCMIIYPIAPKIAAVLFHRDFILASGFETFESRKCPILQPQIINALNRLQFLQCNRQIYARNSLERYILE